MGAINDQDVERIAQEIERYLQSNPNAADSVEGIAKWWLPRQRYVEATGFVQMALDLLVARGRIGKIYTCDGSYIYKGRKQHHT